MHTACRLDLLLLFEEWKTSWWDIFERFDSNRNIYFAERWERTKTEQRVTLNIELCVSFSRLSDFQGNLKNHHLWRPYICCSLTSFVTLQPLHAVFTPQHIPQRGPPPPPSSSSSSSGSLFYRCHIRSHRCCIQSSSIQLSGFCHFNCDKRTKTYRRGCWRSLMWRKRTTWAARGPFVFASLW